MDISVARTFIEIVKTGSFVSAAANLAITQTAVSARIRVLEDQLERAVFIRNKAGARLTPAGEQFLPFANTLVQLWDRARQAVVLPPGHGTVVSVGGELSIASPLLRHWLVCMRRECPEWTLKVHVDTANALIERVQDGLLDVAVLYAAPCRPGIVAELLFEEKLVLVRTTPTDQAMQSGDVVPIDWGETFAASYHAAFPHQQHAAVSISHGPLALDYILAVGGAGYFRKGFVRLHLEQGRLELVPGSPEFSHCAYIVHSASADEGVMAHVRGGLRAAAMIATY